MSAINFATKVKVPFNYATPVQPKNSFVVQQAISNLVVQEPLWKLTYLVVQQN